MADSSARSPWSTLVLRAVLVCLVVKLATWGLGYALTGVVTFDRQEYFGNYGHYLLDTRAASPKRPSFFEIWNYSDGEWYLTLSRQGWIAPAWPRAFGGMELPPEKLLAFIEEMEEYGAARTPDQGEGAAYYDEHVRLEPR